MSSQDMSGFGAPPRPPRPPVAAPPFAVAANILERTHKWVRFMSIVGFLSAGLMMVFGVGAGAIVVGAGQPEALALLFGYVAVGALYLMPSLYLMRYANAGRDFASRQSPGDLEQALEWSRKFWKFAGLLVAISFGVSFGILLLALIAGLMGPQLLGQ